MLKTTLDKVFNPKSVAIIGAKDDPGSVGFGLVRNLIEGEKKRKIYFVNPSRPKVLGIDTYKKVTDIRRAVDLVVIAVPVDFVLGVVKDCASKKVSGVIIISAGFGESGEKGEKIEQEVISVLRKAKIPLIGPNCLGIINSQIDLNASFAPITPKKGNIALLSQSGALLSTFIDIANSNDIGFSKLVSYGNEADLDLSDFILYLGDDIDTKVICFYVEAIKDGKKFMEIAKEVSKKKPLIGLKSGRTKGGQEAASTHTGSIAGNYQVYKTAFKQSGVVIVDTLEEMFDCAKAFVMQPRCVNGLGIVTNGGGAGVLSVDYAESEGIILPEIDGKEIEKNDKKKILNSVLVKRNPLDIIGDALPDRYYAAVESFLLLDKVKVLLVIETTQIVTNPVENARNVAILKKKYPNKPIVCCFLGGDLVTEAVEILEKNGIPNYPELKRAIRAIKNLIKYDK
jgi:acetyltransferase